MPFASKGILMRLTIMPAHLMRILASMAIGSMASALSAMSARADDPKPDKSGYTLFNPTPESALRDFAADRPAKSYGATTIDAGHVQLEVELFNYTTQKIDGIHTQTYVGPNPTARIGLTNSIELQLNIAPFVRQTVHDSFAGTSTSASGVSDFFARAKINLWGNEGGDTAFALIPYIKAGTAPASLGGNQSTEGGIIAPFSIDLKNGVSLTFNSEWDRLKNAADGSYHNQLVQTVGLSGPIAKDVTLTGEFWTSQNFDPAQVSRQYSFDTALAWVPQKNLQFDVGANFGLNKETPALQVYTGVTRRF